uniref:Uncharacterized protein n=1 Tax=Arion vulgaris TaxID=1028688 RepID=A0A0B7A562_9EUPU
MEMCGDPWSPRASWHDTTLECSFYDQSITCIYDKIMTISICNLHDSSGYYFKSNMCGIVVVN